MMAMMVVANQVKRSPMEICSQCIIKLRISYQFQVSVLSGQVVLKLQKKRGLKIRLPQRVKTKLRIVKKDSGGVKQQKGIASPQSSIDPASDLKRPSEIARQQDNNDVSADLSADEDNTSFNLEDYVVVNDRDKPKQNMHKDGKKEYFYCDVCCKKFDEALELEKHKTNAHKVWAHVCPHCPQRYGQSFELEAHLALRHKDAGSKICEVCGRKSANRSYHLRHMRSHQFPPGQKAVRSPFLCTVCGKSFPYSNIRASHMRMHMGIKPIKCGVCNRAFSQKGHLRTHMRTHTGEKPYICEVCGQAFSIKACLDAHIRSKHGKDDGSARIPKKSGKSETVVQSKEPEASETPPAPMFYSREFEEFHQRMLM